MSGGTKDAKGRLVSLDLLRGIDIFLLTVVCGIVGAVNRYWRLPDWVMAQFRHPPWVGFSAHDLIMPLFLFMAGAALPLALPKRLDPDGTAGGRYWRHVLSRVALLWFWGMCVQGCLLSFDLKQISFFNNTLQTIAVGYLITAAVARIPSKALRVAVPFLLAAGYTALLHGFGDLTPEGNFAVIYETKLLKLVYPQSYWDSICVTQIAKWHYTWWTTIPMFGVMSLAGYHATNIILSTRTGGRKTALLAGVGFGLLALGGLLLIFDPCIKHIFTASFTSLAMGCCYLFYSLCYYFADVRMCRKGYSLLLLFGQHSLAAYLLNGCFSLPLKAVAWRFLCDGKLAGRGGDVAQGLLRFLPTNVAKLMLTIGTAVALCFVLWLWAGWKRRGQVAQQPPKKPQPPIPVYAYRQMGKDIHV